MSKGIVVIDVNGGNVQAVFTDLPLEIVLVDWDNINEGDPEDPDYDPEAHRAGLYPDNPLSDMPAETLQQVEAVIGDRHGENLVALDRREINAVLAGLRHLQKNYYNLPDEIIEIFQPEGIPGSFLQPVEIDALCERINLDG